MASTEAPPLSSEELARFQVILDEPAEKLGASFDVYADALAEIVLESSPQFAIGIYQAAVATGAMNVVRLKRKRGWGPLSYP